MTRRIFGSTCRRWTGASTCRSWACCRRGRSGARAWCGSCGAIRSCGASGSSRARSARSGRVMDMLGVDRDIRDMLMDRDILMVRDIVRDIVNMDILRDILKDIPRMDRAIRDTPRMDKPTNSIRTIRIIRTIRTLAIHLPTRDTASRTIRRRSHSPIRQDPIRNPILPDPANSPTSRPTLLHRHTSSNATPLVISSNCVSSLCLFVTNLE